MCFVVVSCEKEGEEFGGGGEVEVEVMRCSN